MHQRMKAAHDRVICAEYPNPRRDENKSRHDRQQGADYPKDEQAYSDHGADDMSHIREPSHASPSLTSRLAGMFHARA